MLVGHYADEVINVGLSMLFLGIKTDIQSHLLKSNRETGGKTVNGTCTNYSITHN